MAGIFDARHVDIENIEEDEGGVNAASKDGRNFAVAGGVAKSVVDVIAQMYPEKEIKVANAEGLKELRNFFSSPKPESTMAIFWKEWHARAAALQVPERCSRSKSPGCGKPLCGKSRTCDERQDRVCGANWINWSIKSNDDKTYMDLAECGSLDGGAASRCKIGIRCPL